MKKQVVVIHGGSSFDDREEYLKYLREKSVDISYFNSQKDWKANLQGDLGEDFEVLLPQMPNKTDARYEEWKIWFDRMISFLNDDVVLVGHSLGGIFLAKYLSENKLPKRIKATMLVAAPFDLANFKLGDSLEGLAKQSEIVILFYSKDDRVVSIEDLEKYSKQLPDAQKIIFKDRGHFRQERFQELVEKIIALK